MLHTRPARWGAILWLGLHAAVAAGALGTAGGLRMPWPAPTGLFAAHACAALFFLLFLWPLLIPAAARAEAGADSVRGLGVQLLLFAALGAPFALLGARVAGTGAGAALRSGAVVAAAAACVVAAFAGGRPATTRAGAAWQLAAWAAAAGAPLAWYLGREWGGADWAWLAALSPFRGAADPGAATPWGPLWAVQAAGLGAAAAVLAATRKALPPAPEHAK
jgi:hypothetical protein